MKSNCRTEVLFEMRSKYDTRRSLAFHARMMAKLQSCEKGYAPAQNKIRIVNDHFSNEMYTFLYQTVSHTGAKTIFLSRNYQ